MTVESVEKAIIRHTYECTHTHTQRHYSGTKILLQAVNAVGGRSFVRLFCLKTKFFKLGVYSLTMCRDGFEIKITTTLETIKNNYEPTNDVRIEGLFFLE